MALLWNQIRDNAIRFSKKFENAAREEADGQSFILGFIELFGAENAREAGSFEYRVYKDDAQRGYIDYLLPGKIAIEMKSLGKDLKKAYAQLKEYVVHLDAEDMPNLLMVCDFQNIQLYNRTTGKDVKFKTKDLYNYVKQFADIAGYEATRVYDKQEEVNINASEKMAKLHNAMESVGYTGHDLQIYLVRLLFCLFADDTGIFPKDAFLNYIENSKEDGSDLDFRLNKLFQVLNTSPDERKQKTLLSTDLLQFCYVNGGLFAKTLPSADFDTKMRKTLIDACLFDWKKISPAIFGAMFQGVMDEKKRHDFGAHYTSEENILKVINPLFMDELWKEFEKVKTSPILLDTFHKKIASLKFLDPACGCGNFLIIAYRELRNLEYAILRMKKQSNWLMIDPTLLLKVNVGQFYGIEIEDFPCQVAQVSMWLVDHLMNMRMAEEFGLPYVRLPLKQSATIIHENALKIDWNDVVPVSELSYIFGNPPFAGARIMHEAQKQDIQKIFAKTKNAGNLDYVCCWFKKAVDSMEQNKTVRTAFVATNSISQGEQVAPLWKPFFERGIQIDFAYRTFKWSNEAKKKATVHCVIVGFSFYGNGKKVIYNGKEKQEVKNINGYLVNFKNIFIESRSKPLCAIPEMKIGNQPIDDGNYLFTEKEKTEFLQKEPMAEKYFKVWLGSDEFIKGKKRYCMWLGDCSPAELKNMPECLKRVEAVRQFRLSRDSTPTKKLAETPRRFNMENMPSSEYIVIPEVSSERRNYIPIGFMPPEVLSSNLVKIIANATLYHFGILTSSVHNAWMRAVAGRLEMRYRYSKELVYNNFPWAEDVTDKQKAKIEELAQEILDTRKKNPNSSLADLYDPLSMPNDLLKAHQKLDTAVLSLYGLSSEITEADLVAELFNRYEKLLEKEKSAGKKSRMKKG